MHKFLVTSVLPFLLCGLLVAQNNKPESVDNWPHWRGPDETGVAPAGDPPVEWSEERNIKWKTEIPGTGNATPVIWGDQIIVLSAVPTDEKVEPEESEEGGENNQWMSPTSTNFIHEFTVFSVDKNSGEIQWKTVVRRELPFSHTHQFGSWASNSPTTDGTHVYAYFGTHGLYCLDMDGKLLWERDLGRMEKVMSFGEGSSPYLYQDKLIVLRDHQGQSTIHLMDKKTGKDIWMLERDEVSSWSTPTVIEVNGKEQIITSATNKIRSYDLETGKVIWECTGMTRNVIPCPVYADGILYLMSGFRGNALFAIDLSKASGDITDSEAIIWKHAENTPYTPSPVLMDGKLYFLKANNGYLSCLDANDGTVYYTNQKLEGIQNIFTSPTGVTDRLYIAGTNGSFSVVKAGTEFEVLSQNTLEDSFLASPVIIGDQLFLRGKKYLYCVAE